MKIVVTDGYTLNSGDLSWEQLSALGDLEVYDRTPGPLVQDRCKDAMIVVTNKTPISKEVIGKLPQLKCISVLATGYITSTQRPPKKTASWFAMCPATVRHP